MSPRSLQRRWVEVPIGAALIVLAPALAALVAHSVLLFPSLGPTALMQVHAPDHRTARPYNIVVGHGVGLLSGFLFAWIFGLAHAPSVFEVHAVSPERAWAAVLAIGLAAILEVVLRAAHPPGAATTLLASLGSFKPTLAQTVQVAVGVLIVAIVGEVVRRARLREVGRSTELP